MRLMRIALLLTCVLCLGSMVPWALSSPIAVSIPLTLKHNSDSWQRLFSSGASGSGDDKTVGTTWHAELNIQQHEASIISSIELPLSYHSGGPVVFALSWTYARRSPRDIASPCSSTGAYMASIEVGDLQAYGATSWLWSWKLDASHRSVVDGFVYAASDADHEGLSPQTVHFEPGHYALCAAVFDSENALRATVVLATLDVFGLWPVVSDEDPLHAASCTASRYLDDGIRASATCIRCTALAQGWFPQGHQLHVILVSPTTSTARLHERYRALGDHQQGNVIGGRLLEAVTVPMEQCFIPSLNGNDVFTDKTLPFSIITAFNVSQATFIVYGVSENNAEDRWRASVGSFELSLAVTFHFDPNTNKGIFEIPSVPTEPVLVGDEEDRSVTLPLAMHRLQWKMQRTAPAAWEQDGNISSFLLYASTNSSPMLVPLGRVVDLVITTDSDVVECELEGRGPCWAQEATTEMSSSNDKSSKQHWFCPLDMVSTVKVLSRLKDSSKRSGQPASIASLMCKKSSHGHHRLVQALIRENEVEWLDGGSGAPMTIMRLMSSATGEEEPTIEVLMFVAMDKDCMVCDTAISDVKAYLCMDDACNASTPMFLTETPSHAQISSGTQLIMFDLPLWSMPNSPMALKMVVARGINPDIQVVVVSLPKLLRDRLSPIQTMVVVANHNISSNHYEHGRQPVIGSNDFSCVPTDVILAASLHSNTVMGEFLHPLDVAIADGAMTNVFAVLWSVASGGLHEYMGGTHPLTWDSCCLQPQNSLPPPPAGGSRVLFNVTAELLHGTNESWDGDIVRYWRILSPMAVVPPPIDGDIVVAICASHKNSRRRWRLLPVVRIPSATASPMTASVVVPCGAGTTETCAAHGVERVTLSKVQRVSASLAAEESTSRFCNENSLNSHVLPTEKFVVRTPQASHVVFRANRPDVERHVLSRSHPAVFGPFAVCAWVDIASLAAAAATGTGGLMDRRFLPVYLGTITITVGPKLQAVAIPSPAAPTITTLSESWWAFFCVNTAVLRAVTPTKAAIKGLSSAAQQSVESALSRLPLFIVDVPTSIAARNYIAQRKSYRMCPPTPTLNTNSSSQPKTFATATSVSSSSDAELFGRVLTQVFHGAAQLKGPPVWILKQQRAFYGEKALCLNIDGVMEMVGWLSSPGPSFVRELPDEDIAALDEKNSGSPGSLMVQHFHAHIEVPMWLSFSIVANSAAEYLRSGLQFLRIEDGTYGAWLGTLNPKESKKKRRQKPSARSDDCTECSGGVAVASPLRYEEITRPLTTSVMDRVTTAEVTIHVPGRYLVCFAKGLSWDDTTLHYWNSANTMPPSFLRRLEEYDSISEKGSGNNNVSLSLLEAVGMMAIAGVNRTASTKTPSVSDLHMLTMIHVHAPVISSLKEVIAANIVGGRVVLVLPKEAVARCGNVAVWATTCCEIQEINGPTKEEDDGLLKFRGVERAKSAVYLGDGSVQLTFRWQPTSLCGKSRVSLVAGWRRVWKALRLPAATTTATGSTEEQSVDVSANTTHLDSTRIIWRRVVKEWKVPRHIVDYVYGNTATTSDTSEGVTPRSEQGNDAVADASRCSQSAQTGCSPVRATHDALDLDEGLDAV